MSPASIEPGIFPKLAFARSIIDEIPTGTQTLSEEQAGGLRAAGKTIDSALAIKPNDSAAVDLKNKIEELLKKPIATMLSLQNLDRLTELLKQRDILAALILRDKMGNADVHDLSITTKLRDIDQQLKDEAERQQVQRSEGYLWAHQPAAQSADWSKALAGGRGRKTRRAFLCIRMENPDREDYFNVVFSNGIVCFRLQDSGTGGAESIHSGECILAGSYQDAHHGQISIETVSHACPRIMIDLPDEGAATAGEILVRAVPVSEMGRLEVDVLPESGLSLAEGRLHVGRRFAPYQSGKPIDPKGHCLMLMMAAGPVQVYVDGGKQLSSIRQQAQIKAGELTKVELKVYSRRIVVFDWKYRLPAGEGEWKTGTTTLLTGDWAPLNNWGVNGSVYALGDWNGTTAGISGVNGSLVPAEPADYTDSQIRATTADWGRADRGVGYPLAVGKAFAVSYGHGKDRGEALMLVRSIRSAIGENGDKP